MKLIYCYMIVLCPFLSMAQTRPVLKSLSIGDTIPDLVFSTIINAPYTSGSTAAYSDKLLLLDFWATWCGSCVKEFPKLDALQTSYKDRLQVLLVNNYKSGDDTFKINKWIAKKPLPTGKKLSLPVVMDEGELEQLFPHLTIPHTVWVYKGKVVAITAGSEVTAAGINSVLGENGRAPENKVERRDFDHYKTFAENIKADPVPAMLYQSVFTRYLNGAGGATGQTITADSFYIRRFFINKPLLALYHFAFPELPGNHVILDSALFAAVHTDTPNTAWKRAHYTCYEQTMPYGTDRAVQQKYMQQDLDRQFGIKSRVEKHWVECYVLQVRDISLLRRSITGNTNGIHKTDSSYQIKAPLSEFVQQLNAQASGKPFYPVVLDETRYAAPVGIELPITDIHDLTFLQQLLPKYGLALLKAKRKVAMLILTKINLHQNKLLL